MPQMEATSVDCVVTDHPYLKAYSTGYRKTIRRATTEILNDRTFDFPMFFSELKRVMKPDAHLYVFGCWQTSAYFMEQLQKHFTIKNRLIWVKNNWTAGDLFWSYGQSYEEIWFAMNGRKKLNGHRDRDVLFYNRVAGNKQVHLNQKPVELLEYLITKSSLPGDTVFDPFMGAGSTGVACAGLGRNFIGVELDPAYFDIAADRIRRNDGNLL